MTEDHSLPHKVRLLLWNVTLKICSIWTSPCNIPSDILRTHLICTSVYDQIAFLDCLYIQTLKNATWRWIEHTCQWHPRWSSRVCKEYSLWYTCRRLGSTLTVHLFHCFCEKDIVLVVYTYTLHHFWRCTTEVVLLQQGVLLGFLWDDSLIPLYNSNWQLPSCYYSQHALL